MPKSPRERLATTADFRRFDIPVAAVINSARKFDAHGEWHFFALMAKVPLQYLFARRRADAHIRRYFYEGRGPTTEENPPADVRHVESDAASS